MQLDSSDALAKEVVRVLEKYTPHHANKAEEITVKTQGSEVTLSAEASIPYYGSKAKEAMEKTPVSEVAPRQEKEVYEAVETYFRSMSDGNAKIQALKNFETYPEEFREDLKKRLSEFFDKDADFANRLRSLVTFFIAREQEMEIYMEFLNERNCWILSFIALEGSGKTHLLDQMKKKTPDIPVARFNFASLKKEQASGQATLKYLMDFTSKIKKYFDQIKYTDLQNKCTVAIVNYNKETIERVPENAITLDQTREERWESGQPEIRATFDELMATFTANRLIIQLDTCERLMDNDGVRRWVIERFLPDLRRKMQEQGKRLHVVIMSSVKLDLSSFKDEIYPSTLEPLTLKSLNEQAVQELLGRIGVTDGKLCKHFYEMTEGHARYVEILYGLWQEWKGAGKELPMWEEAGKEPSDFKITQFIRFQMEFYRRAYDDFAERVRDKVELSREELAKYGIILREFDFDKFAAIFHEKEKKEEVFERLIKLPFIEQKGDKFQMRGICRAVLGRSTRMLYGKKWREWHSLARSYLLDKHLEVGKRADYKFLQNDPIREINLWDETRNFFYDCIAGPMKDNSPPDLSDWYYHGLAQLLVESNETNALLYWEINLDILSVLGVEQNHLVDAALDKTLMFTKVAYKAQRYP